MGSHHRRLSAQLDLPGSGGQSASADFPIEATTWMFLPIFLLSSYHTSSSMFKTTKENKINEGGAEGILGDNHLLVYRIGSKLKGLLSAQENRLVNQYIIFSCPEQLLKPSCPSVRRSVGPSVRPSVRHVCEK